jgi:VWFA-related protein
MTRLHRAFAAALTALVLAAGAASAAAQKPAPAGPTENEQGVFVETVHVAVVDVDVYVTDKKGNRVTGLTKDDFEVFEDGRPVAITHFSAIEGGRLQGQQPAAAGAGGAPEVAGVGSTGTRVPEDQRLHLVVYIDNFNMQPFNRNRVLRELRDFLREKLDTEDRVMLVSYDRELHVRHGWTRDPTVIASALQDLETVSGQATHRESDRRDALERIDQSESVQEAESYARTYAGSTFNDLAFTIDALRDIVGGLAGLPGRKAVLYVSEGIPMIAGEDLFHAVQAKFSTGTSLTEAFEFDASRRFRELTAAANANRVTFYTIDVGGLRTYSYADASQQTPGQGAFVDQVYISNLQSPLQLMAEATGGKAIINTNRVGPSLEEVAEDFNSYYSLGYSPSHFGDGRYYKIEVKVKDRRGLTVRSREGYRDKPPETRMSDGTMAALLHGFVTNPLGIKLDFGPQSRDDQGLFLVTVRLSIPLDKVVLVPGADTNEARLRVWVAAMDDDGGMSDVQEVPVSISIPSAEVEKARQQYYLYSLNLQMRGGQHRVAVGARDDVGGESSFITGSVAVGGP